MQMTSFLAPTQRYASGALFALALHQAQIHQTRPLGFSDDDARAEERTSSCSGSSTDSVSEDPELWVHETSGLLRPVFSFLEIDSAAWSGLEETAGSGTAKHHIGAFLRLLSEDNEISSEMIEQELALSKSVDGIADNMMKIISSQSKEKYREYEDEWREKCLPAEAKSNFEESDKQTESTDGNVVVKQPDDGAWTEAIEQPIEEEKMLSHQRKVVILYELLSACLADISVNKKQTRQRKGYDARHRVALRLLSTWIDIKWIKMEAIETMVACSAMALAKSVAEMGEESPTKESNWNKWKRGGIIGAAALTGGTLMAITGGLAAPAIAAGFGALAPTLGTIIPVIGASGFAAAASAAGTVAGSVAVAASFGAAGAGLTGSKMARRIGSIDEFEFKSIGENHNQGRLAVEITVSGFAFDDKDFVRPWEGLNNNLERYALQWESKNIIAVSTAIQDWLTSRLAMELMKRGAMMTVLSSLLVALAWPATLLAATDFIDSKWTIAVDRSDKAGRILADVLLKGLQGNRPVTLVGYSLGARVIFKCLQYLAETEKNAELVERVVLLGAPISIKDQNWEAARKMVAGRFVNVYSTNDWMLGIAFRASLLTQGLAGIQPIDVPGIENNDNAESCPSLNSQQLVQWATKDLGYNGFYKLKFRNDSRVDVTDVIEGHSSYLWATRQILEQLELETYYPVFRSSSDKQ